MRVLIFGATGMLGHKLYQSLRSSHEVYATVRTDISSIERFGIFDPDSIISDIDVSDPSCIRKAFDAAKPECVVNAVGVIKQVPEASDVITTLELNAIFPHRLHDLSRELGFRLITIGTDCVFDGKTGNYSETDQPDARDIYGLSKFIGEVTTDNCLTIRTSIIGRELDTSHSLVEWFLSKRGGTAKGYLNAIYSGFPTIILAEIISGLIDKPSLNGLYHISSDPISKFQLLRLINEHYRAGIDIDPFEDYKIDRSLDCSRFKNATGFAPQSWPEMIRQMAADQTPYDQWR